MFKKLMEIVTAFGALFLLSGVDSSIWCGILGLALLVLFPMAWLALPAMLFPGLF